MSARVPPTRLAQLAGQRVPAIARGVYSLYGRGNFPDDRPARQAEARIEECSSALLSLYAPCSPADFPARAMDVVGEILPAELLTFELVDLHTGEVSTRSLRSCGGEGDTAGNGDDEIEDRWRDFIHEHPILRAHLRTGGESVATYDLEDVLPEAARAGLPIERDLFQPLGIRHQLAAMFPAPDAAAGIFVSRGGTFSQSDRRVLSLLAPHLAQAYHHHLLLAPLEARPPAYRHLAWQRLRSGGFSRRECEVLQWLAEGKGDDEIAIILGLSRKTVSNHVFELTHKLGARNRIGVVTAALQIIEMPHPVELETAPHDREEEFQARLVKLAGAPTPATVLLHLRQILADWWPGLEAQAWLVRLDDKDHAFAALAPSRVDSYAQRLSLCHATGNDGARPVLGAASGSIGAVRWLPLPPSAYVWENRVAPAGDLLTALVLVPERLAFAIVAGVDAREFGAARLAEWHRLVPHLLVAARGAHRLVHHGCGPLVPAPTPESALWHTLSRLHLTDRQAETLAWVAAGEGDQEIADRLGVSARTVHAHLRAVFELLGVENRLGAVLAACRHFTQQLAYEGD